MSKVLVTGAAGFIASQVCEKLLQEGLEVVGIDNINDYYDIRLKNYRLEKLNKFKNFQFHKLDIEDLAGVKVLFEKNKFKTVYNLAARAGVRGSVENPFIYVSTNTMGSLNLLDQIKSGGVKYVLASTSSLYAGQKLPFREDLPVNSPISPYAASKKGAEMMAYSYHFLYGIDVSVVRYFTVYGPAGRPDMSIFRFIQWIDKGEKMEILGDGAQSRDFTYVSDIAAGTIKAAKNVGYEVINLGGGKKPISINDVIKKIEEALGKKATMDNHAFHKADLKETWADIDKAKKLIDWEPVVSFEEGIAKTIDWYKNNLEMARNIKL
ncbi:MAG: GDP-mannose 4,6-dehydratase [Pseudobdellovibrionaceae bacterium]